MMYLITGVLLILLPVLFNVAFFMLGRLFEYPAILRQPTATILLKFNAGGARLIAWWYVFAFAAILFIPLPVLFYQIINTSDTPYLLVGTVIGVLAGVMQVLGLLRWSFLVPTLARSYLNPEASNSERDAAAIVFQAFHQYAGAALGEHLGYMFTAVWTLFAALATMGSAFYPAWFGWIGILAALGILIGLLEPLGVRFAGAVNAISYIVWSLWLIAAGVLLLLH